VPDGTAHYNPDDFARLRPVEDTHFWFVSRNDILAAALSTLPTNCSAADCVLEIGCGTGNTLRVLREGRPRATIIGMDAFHAGLLFAQSRADAQLVEGRVEAMPFSTDFALIGMFDVLEHIEDDVAALRSVREALVPRGHLLMTVPAAPSLWSRYDTESHHHRRYTEAHLRRVLAEAHFHVEYVTHFMSVTYPAIWISRRLERWRAPISSDRSSRAPAIERELCVPHVINTVLRQLLRVETPAVRRRYRLPFGASLLAIATP
jgi:SAM-dependent methyltransferase